MFTNMWTIEKWTQICGLLKNGHKYMWTIEKWTQICGLLLSWLFQLGDMAEKHSYTEEMEAEVKFFKKGQAISLNTDHNDHHHHMTSYCITIFQDWGQRPSWDAGDQDAGGHPQVKMAIMMAMMTHLGNDGKHRIAFKWKCWRWKSRERDIFSNFFRGEVLTVKGKVERHRLW